MLFAAAGRPGDREDLSGRKLERDISEDGELAPARRVGAGQRFRAQDRHGAALSSRHHIGNPRAARRSDAAGAAARGVRSRGPAARATPGLSPPAATAAASAPVDDRPVVLFVGTSLTAGFGLDPSEAFPALVQQKIDAAGLRYRVVNAGVSGETSAGRCAVSTGCCASPWRCSWWRRAPTTACAARDPDATREPAGDPRRRAPQAAAAAASCWPRWRRRPTTARTTAAGSARSIPSSRRRAARRCLPFLLDGVAGDPKLNQPDGIHPTAEGERRVAENVWKVLRPIL